VEAVRARAEALVQLGRLPEAREAYANLVKALPFDAVLRASLGGLQETYEAKIADLDKAVALAPGAAWTGRDRGMIHLFHDRLDPATRDLQKAVTLDPADSNAMDGLFMAASLIGDGEGTESWGKKALAANPEDYDLSFQLGIFYRTVGRHEEAITYFDQALVADPKFGLYLWARGRSRLKCGLYADGIRDMFDAVSLGDLSPNARKLFEGVRSASEKQVAGTTNPAQIAKYAENLIAMLNLLLSTASEDRKRQYEASILTLRWVVSDMYEKAEKWDQALEAIKPFKEPSAYDWAIPYRRARVCSEKADFEEAKRQLRICRDHGMGRLGAVRMDDGFHRLRDTDGWPAFVKDFEAGQ
jgi:tetratricopeptide (TPR) repeat protein